MDTVPTDPGLAVEPPAPCPSCGAGCGCGANPLAEDIAMLGELAAIGLRMVRRAERQVEAAGHLDQAQALTLEMTARTVRRTIALRERLFADGRKTPEQLAAERARRAARAEAERMRPAEPARPAAAAESGPSDRENLLSDLHERLLEPDIAAGLTREAASAIILTLCQAMRITPKDEWWSHALLKQEIHARHEATGGADWREGVEFTPPPGVVTKRGRFTFGPDGAVVAEEKWDVPQSEWPPDILGGRDPPDTG